MTSLSTCLFPHAIITGWMSKPGQIEKEVRVRLVGVTGQCVF